MKIPARQRQYRAAFTLIELLISTTVVAIAGGSIFLAVQSGLTLFAKNTSVNVAHQQLLRAVQRITRDAHASIATPTLLNADLTVNAGTGPAAGVSFQVPWQKPFKITAAASSGTNKIRIDTNSAGATPSPRPSAGQRILLPGQDMVEENITAVAAAPAPSPAYTDVTLQNSVWKNIFAMWPNGGVGYDRAAVIVDKIAYVLVNGELHFYTQQYSGGSFSWLDRGIRARGMPTTGAFSTPFSISNNRTVTGNFSVGDPTYSNRGYKATNMSLTFQAPYRTKLTNY